MGVATSNSPRGSDVWMNGDSTEFTGSCVDRCVDGHAASVVAGPIGSFSFAPSVVTLWLMRQREKGVKHSSGIESSAA
eukprot:4007331-Pleurochrysis_carterae.AAC.1